MKIYNELNFGIDYYVIEYNDSDYSAYGLNHVVLNEIIESRLVHKYIKVIDNVYNEINYYMDGMKHNDNGPASVNVNKNKEVFYINDDNLENNEFKNYRRTKLIDDMLNDCI